MFGCHLIWRKKTARLRLFLRYAAGMERTRPILKQMMTDHENCIKRKNFDENRLRSEAGESSQTVDKPGLTARKVLLCVWGD